MASGTKLQFGSIDYELVPHGDPRREFVDRGDYQRVPGRTDEFLVYAARAQAAQRARLVLHTPESLALNGRRKYMAEKIAPWSYTEVLTGEPALTQGTLLPPEFKDMLWYDGKVEGDSVRFFNHLATSGIQVEHEFWPVLLLWLRDEANHSAGFRAMYNAIYGADQEREAGDAKEASDFEPMREILADPFALTISLACDELLTIQTYRQDMERYTAMGPQAEAFVKRVIADEGWHLQKFLKYAVAHHADRVPDLEHALALCKQGDATEYARTFMFDRGAQAGAKQVTASAEEQARGAVKKLFLRMLAA